MHHEVPDAEKGIELSDAPVSYRRKEPHSQLRELAQTNHQQQLVAAQAAEEGTKDDQRQPRVPIPGRQAGDDDDRLAFQERPHQQDGVCPVQMVLQDMANVRHVVFTLA